jgi:hypothetical protein
MPHQSEPRFNSNLMVRAFGIDADGRPFSQEAHAINISDRGAKLCGLERHLALGEVIGVQLGEQKARCRVIWTVYLGKVLKNDIGVRILEGQPCPWKNERDIQEAAAAVPILRIAPEVRDNRKFSRQWVPFPVEIQDGEGVSTHMKTVTSDITGRGCYVETMLPLPVETVLNITFWLHSERIRTTAIVRTSHGGVGMGIEFIGLDDATQKQLQQVVENLAIGNRLPASGARSQLRNSDV